MAETPVQKFNLGDTVKSKASGETGEVLGFSFNSEGFIYTVSSVEVDVREKKLINGVRTHREEELVEATKDEAGEEESVEVSNE